MNRCIAGSRCWRQMVNYVRTWLGKPVPESPHIDRSPLKASTPSPPCPRRSFIDLNWVSLYTKVQVCIMQIILLNPKSKHPWRNCHEAIGQLPKMHDSGTQQALAQRKALSKANMKIAELQMICNPLETSSRFGEKRFQFWKTASRSVKAYWIWTALGNGVECDVALKQEILPWTGATSFEG